MSPLRTTLGLALAVCLALVLYLALRVERGGRGTSVEAPASGSVPGAHELVEPGVAASAPASTPAEARAVVGASGEPAAEEHPVPTLRVLVRDALDGRPLAGALVTLFDRATPLAQRTEADGTCHLTLVAPGEPARLRVEAEGHFHANFELVPATNQVVELARAAVLFGRVLAADSGEPVAGAELALVHDSCEGCEPERVRAGAGGGFELPGVPLRMPAGLEVRAPGFAFSHRSFELRSDAPRVRQDIHLVRGVELAGSVEDSVSGRPLAGVKVGELVTDAEGRFQGSVLTLGATGRTEFEVRAAEHASLRVTLDLAQAKELLFRLPELAHLEGQVTDASGQPLAGAEVGFSATGPQRGAGGALTETSPLYELPAG